MVSWIFVFGVVLECICCPRFGSMKGKGAFELIVSLDWVLEV